MDLQSLCWCGGWVSFGANMFRVNQLLPKQKSGPEIHHARSEKCTFGKWEIQSKFVRKTRFCNEHFFRSSYDLSKALNWYGGVLPPPKVVAFPHSPSSSSTLRARIKIINQVDDESDDDDWQITLMYYNSCIYLCVCVSSLTNIND